MLDSSVRYHIIKQYYFNETKGLTSCLGGRPLLPPLPRELVPEKDFNAATFTSPLPTPPPPTVLAFLGGAICNSGGKYIFELTKFGSSWLL